MATKKISAGMADLAQPAMPTKPASLRPSSLSDVASSTPPRNDRLPLFGSDGVPWALTELNSRAEVVWR